jgi:hypothetical protein
MFSIIDRAPVLKEPNQGVPIKECPVLREGASGALTYPHVPGSMSAIDSYYKTDSLAAVIAGPIKDSVG